MEETTIPEVSKVPQTPVRRQKRLLLREPPTPTIPRSFDSPLPRTPDTDWVLQGSTYTRNPDRDPFYSRHQRVAFPPTWYHQGEDVHGFPPYDPTTGGHGRYDYGGRQYLRPEVAVPESPYRFNSVADYPKPPERQSTTPNPKRKRYVPAFAVDADVPAWKDSTSPMQLDHLPPAPRPSASPANSLLDSGPKSAQELKRVLPRVAKDQKNRTSKAQNHRPPDRQITLALRPASSVESLKGREREASPTPAPALKRRRTSAALSNELKHADSNSRDVPTTSIPSRP